MSDPSANQPTFSLDGVPGVPPAEAPPASPSTEPPAQPQPQPAELNLSPYAQDLIGGITDPAEKAVVERYLGKWDAGVQRQVSTLQGLYSPLQPILDAELDPSDIELMTQLYSVAANDADAAIRIIESMKAQGGYQQPSQQQGQYQVGQQGQQQGQQPAQAQLPPEVMATLQRQEQFMQQMAMAEQQRQSAAEAAAEDQALAHTMQLLHQEKGAFDEEAVMGLMLMGYEAGTAVDRWRGSLQQQAAPAVPQPPNQFQGYTMPNIPQAPQAPPQVPNGNGANGGTPRLPAPPVLNGGSAPTGPQPIHQAPDAVRKAAVAKILLDAQRQG